MATVNTNPTTATTADPGQGGVAVTGAVNTGHASTQSLKSGAGATTKTCMWNGFSSVAGTITSVILKVDWIQNGSASDGFVGTANQFTIDYSINGGGAWLSLRNVSQIGALTSGTSTVTLLTSQNLTQVRVRDALIATGVLGETAEVTATISNIRIEVVTTDPSRQQQVSGMM
jgi:hypothetical protein